MFKTIPKCPTCHGRLVKTCTVKAVRGTENLEVDVYACFKHRYFTTVKRNVKEGKEQNG
jgi:hypothetical protein